MSKVKSYLFLFGIVFGAAILRFHSIDTIPHGLYIDEVSIGHNAYTILTTGKDEYGKVLPLFFQAFGEYKLPVYIYLSSFSMAIFGKTEFAVRFMSALFGSGTVLLFYFFLKQLFSFNEKSFSITIKRFTPFVGTFLLAITPWHVQLSRGGFEATVATFFYLLGLYFLLKYYSRKKAFLLSAGLVALIITMYTYSSFRILTPLTLITTYFLLFIKLSKKKKELFLSGVLVILLLIPMAAFSFSHEGVSRFFQTSAFGDNRSLIEKIFTYPIIYLKNYLSFFSSSFLFVTGDGIGRHTIKGIGPLFRTEFIFILVGGFYLVKERSTVFAKTIIFLLFLSPLAAALTIPSPHLLRSILFVIPLSAAAAFGCVKLWELLSKLRYIALALIFILLFEFGQFLHLYFIHYPLITALDWGAEYKQMVIAASNYQTKYDKIVINTTIGDFHEYIRFYNTDLDYTAVGSLHGIPKEWQDEKVLYITSPDPKKDSYIKNTPKKHLQTIYFPNKMHDTFVQFWEL